MLRVYNSDWSGAGSLPGLPREEVHHLVRVRRVRVGEQVEILNGRGHVGLAEVRSVAGSSLDLDLVSVREDPPPALQVRLLVALPKGKTFALLLHKAVELGVSRITPLVTENVEVPPERAGKKLDRWESVLVEAVKQSGNPRMPQLDLPTLLDAALMDSTGMPVCAALQPDARPLWALLRDTLKPAGIFDVFVGPEGDFSLAEYDQLRSAGCHFVTLGPLVLKVETAASLVIGALQLWAQGAE